MEAFAVKHPFQIGVIEMKKFTFTLNPQLEADCGASHGHECDSHTPGTCDEADGHSGSHHCNKCKKRWGSA